VQDTKRNAVSIRNQRHPSARSALGQAGMSHSAMDGPRLCVVLARCRKRPRPARLAVSSARRERGSGGGRRGGAAGGEPAHGCLHVARPITLAHWVDTDVGRIRRVQRRAREVVCRHKLRNAHCQKAHRARSARTGARLLTKLNMFGGGYFRLDTNPLLPVRFAKEHFVNTKEPVSCVLTKCSFVFTKCSSDFHIFRTKPWQRRRSKCHELPLTLAILRMRFRIAWSRFQAHHRENEWHGSAPCHTTSSGVCH